MLVFLSVTDGHVKHGNHRAVSDRGVHGVQAATVDDLYEALAQFRLDDDNLFTVIGTSGAAPPPPPPPLRKGELLVG